MTYCNILRGVKRVISAAKAGSKTSTKTIRIASIIATLDDYNTPSIYFGYIGVSLSNLFAATLSAAVSSFIKREGNHGEKLLFSGHKEDRILAVFLDKCMCRIKPHVTET